MKGKKWNRLEIIVNGMAAAAAASFIAYSASCVNSFFPHAYKEGIVTSTSHNIEKVAEQGVEQGMQECTFPDYGYFEVQVNDGGKSYTLQLPSDRNLPRGHGVAAIRDSVSRTNTANVIVEEPDEEATCLRINPRNLQIQTRATSEGQEYTIDSPLLYASSGQVRRFLALTPGDAIKFPTRERHRDIFDENNSGVISLDF